MKLGLVQMAMKPGMDENYHQALEFMDQTIGMDLLVFPRLQLNPFFPRVHGLNADVALSRINDTMLSSFAYQAKKRRTYLCPNVYLLQDEHKYNASLWFDKNGVMHKASYLVHVQDQRHFHEKEYFEPSPDGFIVHDTQYGKIGVVIGSDRHFPESVRTCALQGAQLVIIPVANAMDEDIELYEWELRSQAYENGIFIAMVNRCGTEGRMEFAGGSFVAGPDGSVIIQADNIPQIITCDIDLKQADAFRKRKDYLSMRRPELYHE